MESSEKEMTDTSIPLDELESGMVGSSDTVEIESPETPPPEVTEEQKKIEVHSLKKLISTMLTVVALIFGGAGAIYGLEKDDELNGEVFSKYLNCVYFCVVTLTTIGYGDMSPKTNGGKAFMVIYAMISLGVMAAAITSVGQVIVARANKQKDDFMKVSKNITKKLKRLTRTGHQASEKDLNESMKKEMEKANSKKKQARWYIRLVGLLSLIAVAVFVGAKGFSELENWAYGDAVYYCMITLLTIGYGDFYPKTDGGKIFFIFYVFIGLGLIAFVVGDIGEKVLSNTQAKLQEAKLQKTLMNNLSKLNGNISKIAKLPKFPKMSKEKRNSKNASLEDANLESGKELNVD